MFFLDIGFDYARASRALLAIAPERIVVVAINGHKIAAELYKRAIQEGDLRTANSTPDLPTYQDLLQEVYERALGDPARALRSAESRDSAAGKLDIRIDPAPKRHELVGSACYFSRFDWPLRPYIWKDQVRTVWVLHSEQ